MRIDRFLSKRTIATYVDDLILLSGYINKQLPPLPAAGAVAVAATTNESVAPSVDGRELNQKPGGLDADKFPNIIQRY